MAIQTMDFMNYHHLRLFWAVAREGNLTRASRSIGLSPQTVSTQINQLERALGEELFRREGRGMVLTEVGQVALKYANEIFSLGREFQETVREQGVSRALHLSVGVADVVPKLVAHRLILPALHLNESVRVDCREGTPRKLLTLLATHELDVVLSDGPIPSDLGVRAYNHELGQCGVAFMATEEMAKELCEGFPGSLENRPVLLPREETSLRKNLERWFAEKNVRPRVVGEFDDSALLKVFGQAGAGFFAVPLVTEQEVIRQYRVATIARTDEVQERYFAISSERRIRHEAVVAICDTARHDLFATK